MQIDFTILEAGCLLYAADRNLGATPFGLLHEAGWKALTLKKAIVMTSLYQDDGYNVRVRLGDPTAAELAEWTGKAAWKINLETGRMVVSGVCDEDLEEYLKDFPAAENGGRYELGCLVEAPPGEYSVTIYSYPPGDLSGGLMRIEQPELFRACFGDTPGSEYEKLDDYFARTRPGEPPPDWIKNGYEEANFLDFLIHLAPIVGEIKVPEFEPDGCIRWEYRKPAVCPIGIRL